MHADRRQLETADAGLHAYMWCQDLPGLGGADQRSRNTFHCV